jgi:membrane dipeptidase
MAAEVSSAEGAVSEKHGENEAQSLLALQRLGEAFIRAGRLPQVSWEKIIAHIDHAVAIAGPGHVGIGSDFDGAFMPAGMEDASMLPRLTEGLLKRGYAEADIRKILGQNTLRVMADAERAAQPLQAEKS